MSRIARLLSHHSFGAENSLERQKSPLKAETHRTRNRNATFQFLKANKMTLEINFWRFCMQLESTSYPAIVILSSFSRGTNIFASEITKIASRYGFASGVSWPLIKRENGRLPAPSRFPPRLHIKFSSS